MSTGDPATVLGLPPGNWAEWVAGIGTILAFSATSLAIWQGHRLRRIEHAEAMHDEALRVTSAANQGSQYFNVVKTDGMVERKSRPMVDVTVFNGGRRQITNVTIEVITSKGQRIGADSVEFIQAGRDHLFQFDPVDGVWQQFGSSPGIDALVALAFEDIDETKWVLGSDGRLLRNPRL